MMMIEIKSRTLPLILENIREKHRTSSCKGDKNGIKSN